MSDIDRYIPTAKLRWHYENDIMEPVLQQWFVSDNEWDEPEWRDVPSDAD